MPSPFPGMDPYLEDPRLWPDVHHELVSAIRVLLNQVIRPKYVARLEERVYMVPDDDPEHRLYRVPDVKIDAGFDRERRGPLASAGGMVIAEPDLVRAGDPIRESRIEVLDVSKRKVVTVIELLSPSNKLKGSAGRKSFLKKRRQVMDSRANWVEMDFLRMGTVPAVKRRYPHHQYLVHSSPAALRPDSKAWPIRLQNPLPIVGIPLRAPDPDAPLSLQQALNMAYERGSYDATAEYTKEPTPPLPPELAAWAAELLRANRGR